MPTKIKSTVGPPFGVVLEAFILDGAIDNAHMAQRIFIYLIYTFCHVIPQFLALRGKADGFIIICGFKVSHVYYIDGSSTLKLF